MLGSKLTRGEAHEGAGTVARRGVAEGIGEAHVAGHGTNETKHQIMKDTIGNYSELVSSTTHHSLLGQCCRSGQFSEASPQVVPQKLWLAADSPRETRAAATTACHATT